MIIDQACLFRYLYIGPGEGGRGGLPTMGYIGMYGLKAYGFLADLVIIK